MTTPGGQLCDVADAAGAVRAGDAAARSGTVTGSAAAAPSAAPPAFIVERNDALLCGGDTAWFSRDRVYRYLLTRRWGDSSLRMTFIMLNPSTADAFEDDPTIRRCIRFARREGCGGLNVLNLFALRATDPAALRGHPDPVGPDNTRFLAEHTRDPFTYTVAAWGTGGTLNGRGTEVGRQLRMPGLSSLLCLGTTGAGHPRHPLYVRGDAPLIPWEPPS